MQKHYWNRKFEKSFNSHDLNIYLNSCCWMKIGWNGITDCLSAVHLVTQLLLDCIELVANCWSLSNFYIRLEIKKSIKLPIFFSMTLPYFCCLGSEVIILSEIEKYPTSCCIFRWPIKRLLLWRLCKFLFPVYVLYSSIKRLFLLRFCKFFPLFLSDPCPIIVYTVYTVTNWLTDWLTHGLVEKWMSWP